MTTALTVTKPIETEALIVHDQVDASKLLASIGEKEEGWEIPEQAPRHFWKPEANQVLVGKLARTFTYEKTKFGPMSVYVLNVLAPVVGDAGGEAEMLSVGDEIGVIDRKTLNGLSKLMGRTVAIICDGLINLKDGNTCWIYRYLVKKA